MLTVINYSDERFAKARAYNTETAYKYGADIVIEYSPSDMPEFFRTNFPQWCVENDPVIGRYGLWRPYIVLDALDRSEEGDYVCYCDAGVYFIRPINMLCEVMEKNNTDIMVFGLPFIEKEWTKRDVFIALNVDENEFTDTQQILSTIFIVKKCKHSVLFMQEYAQIAKQYPDLFTDIENKLGEPNYEGFISNRHNQSVLSVLSKREHLSIYRDPSEYGLKPALYKYSVIGCTYKPLEYMNSRYPQITVHHRSKSIRKDVFLFAWCRRYLPPFITVKMFSLGHRLKYMFRNRKFG